MRRAVHVVRRVVDMLKKALGKLADWIGAAIVGLVVIGLWAWLRPRPLVLIGAIAGAVVVSLVVLGVTALRRHPPPQWLLALLGGITVGVILGGALVTLLPDGGPTCDVGDGEGTVEVMVVWEGDELDAFNRVVGEYNRDVRVTSVGPEIGAALDDCFEAGKPPDVAMIPQPSLVQRYAAERRLQPISQAVVDRYPSAWTDFVSFDIGPGDDPVVYGAFVKAAHKSMFWYQDGGLGHPPEGGWPTWNEFASWLQSEVRPGSTFAPLTVAAANRYPLTDWFENQLAAIDPEIYDALAEDIDGSVWDREEVREALRQMGTIWATPDLFLGGPEGASGTEWAEMPGQLDTGEASVAFGPSYVAGPAQGRNLWVFGFPPMTRSGDGAGPQVVGGDIAVVMRGSAEGQELVDWLTDEAAMESWSREDPGFLTPNERSPHGHQDTPDELRRFLTFQLQNPEGGELHYDLSDQLGALNDDDPHASWEIFDQFFHDVTGGVEISCAIERAVQRLEAEARGAEWPSVPC